MSISTKKKQRLLGIDLCRGLAAYAVILVHSGDETWGVPVSDWAIRFRLLFYFAVPFFLATSFFFTTRKLNNNTSLHFWLSKFQRILIPYAIWSIVYLVFRTVVFSLTNQTARLNELLQDPLSIIFFGGASYHLYFLPLLLSGTLLFVLKDYFVTCRFEIKTLAWLSTLSIIINELIVSSGNSFHLNSSSAFPNLLKLIEPNAIGYPIARLILVEVAWILQCMPYFLIAIALNHLLLKAKPSLFNSKGALLLFFAIFIFVNLFREIFLSSTLSGIMVAYSLLIVGIGLSSYLKDSSLIKNLGKCSFGIYLIHPFLLRLTEIIFIFVAPKLTTQVTIMSMLSFSVPSFFMSWLVVSFMMKNKQLNKYMFGN